MKTAFLFHDSFSNPQSDWFPWVKVHLEAQGYFVIAPAFPTGGAQSLQSWLDVFQQYRVKINDQTIFIGHGTGSLFALRVLESLEVPVFGTILVAPYARNLSHQAIQEVSQSFLKEPFSWDRIKRNAGVVKIFHGSDDPFVPKEEGSAVAQSLDVSLSVIEGAGHVTRATGYTQFLQIVASVRDIHLAHERLEEAQSPETQERERQFSEALAQNEEKRTAALRARGFRSMHEDMGRILKETKGQIASGVLMKTREEEIVRKLKNPLSPKNLLFIIFGAFSIAAGVILVGWILFKNSPVELVPYVDTINAPIRAERNGQVGLDGKSILEAREKIETVIVDNPPAVDTVTHYIPTKLGRRLSLEETLTALGIQGVPSIVYEHISPSYMWAGFALDRKITVPFVVFETQSYDGAYRALRDWESVLAQDLSSLFALPDDFLAIQKRWLWSDDIVLNHNVRVLRFEVPPLKEDASLSLVGTSETASASSLFQKEEVTYSYQEGDPVLLYTFLNNRTVVVTTDERILPDLMRRFADRQVLQ